LTPARISFTRAPIMIITAQVQQQIIRNAARHDRSLNERGYYEGTFGALRYQGDVRVQQRIDPTADVRR
jgi:hypothetical protein